jgi:hypothetical protein
MTRGLILLKQTQMRLRAISESLKRPSGVLPKKGRRVVAPIGETLRWITPSEQFAEGVMQRCSAVQGEVRAQAGQRRRVEAVDLQRVAGGGDDDKGAKGCGFGSGSLRRHNLSKDGSL